MPPKSARPAPKFPGFGAAEHNLFRALQEHSAAKITKALEAPINVRARSAEGWPLLVWAACQGSALAVGALLARGANPAATARKGMSALHWAAFESGQRPDVAPEIARLLLAAGADLEKADHAGWLPLTSAAAQGCLALVELLLDAGAAIDAPGSRDGNAALHFAALHARPEIAGALIERGASALTKNSRNQTPLEMAAPGFRPFMEEALIARELPEGAAPARLRL